MTEKRLKMKPAVIRRLEGTWEPTEADPQAPPEAQAWPAHTPQSDSLYPGKSMKVTSGARKSRRDLPTDLFFFRPQTHPRASPLATPAQRSRGSAAVAHDASAKGAEIEPNEATRGTKKDNSGLFRARGCAQ